MAAAGKKALERLAALLYHLCKRFPLTNLLQVDSNVLICMSLKIQITNQSFSFLDSFQANTLLRRYVLYSFLNSDYALLREVAIIFIISLWNDTVNDILVGTSVF